MHMHAPHLQLAPSLPARPSCDHPGCGFATRTLRALFSHVREADHAGMLCPLPNCPLRFKHETTLNDHKVSGAHAGVGGQPLLCKTCSRTFGTVAEYKAHCGLHRLQNLEKSGCREKAAAKRAERELLLTSGAGGRPRRAPPPGAAALSL